MAVEWQVATVSARRQETPRVVSLTFALPRWAAHLPGQHYDVRLTAPDGYTAQRSYSVASSPLDERVVQLTVDRLEDGEVSPYLTEVLVEGDQVELRGPLGGYFVWRGEAPLLLVGGGSGVVPLMAMLRHRRRAAPDVPARLLYSTRTVEDLIYADELGPETTVRLSRSEGRIDGPLVRSVAFPPADGGIAFVCGSDGFVEAAADLLVEQAGYAPGSIRTERFGATG